MSLRIPTLLTIAALALTSGCHAADEREGQAAVQRYLDLLAKAYRASDAELVDPLLGDEQGLKVTGLIGVKRDMGLVLDATLLQIEFDKVTRDGAALVVETRERWKYLDRRIGTGQPAGPESTDAYRMRYRFERKEGKLLLADLSFIEAPEVGQAGPAYRLPVEAAHGSPPGRGDQAPPGDLPGGTSAGPSGGSR
jgi:hypothetical protein